MSDYNSVFWIEVEKINPNPYQPRQEFDEDKLRDLADSIRQYGVLQPLVVTRKEIEADTGLRVEYELIAGERRLRAAKLAGLYQVPAIIRSGEQTDKMKLEMAIIENLQREDLNPVDRAKAFVKLTSDFNLKHVDIAKKIGKSREYVANSVRILGMPEDMIVALMAGKINEGHTRPILMLNDRPAEQRTVFQEIMNKRLTVREAESIARRIAYDKVRKRDTFIDPDLIEFEDKLAEKFGTRVRIARRKSGGQLTIDFFSPNDLNKLFDLLGEKEVSAQWSSIARRLAEDYSFDQAQPADEIPADNETPAADEDSINQTGQSAAAASADGDFLAPSPAADSDAPSPAESPQPVESAKPQSELTDNSQAAPAEEDDLYSVKNFSI